MIAPSVLSSTSISSILNPRCFHGFDSEKGQKRVALLDLAVRSQSVVIRRQRRLVPMFDDYDAVFGEHAIFCNQPHDGRVDFGHDSAAQFWT